MKKLKTLLEMVLLLGSILFFLAPDIYTLSFNRHSEQAISDFQERYQALTDAQGEITSDSSDCASSESGKLASDFSALFEQFQSYNEQLYREKQSQLADTWSYEQFSIDSDALEDDLIGFVDIPSIDVQLPLYLGATDAHLAQGVAVMGQTSIPIGGTNTNSVIAGHRGYRGAPYFREIESIQVGDMVSITNPFEVLTYQVTETKIIAPDDMESILIQDGKDMVTLLTCHPYRSHGKFRYVVYCERVEQPVSTSQTAKSEEPQNKPFSFFSSATSSTTQAADSSQSDIALERTVRIVCALLLLILVLSLLIPAKKS